MSARKSSKYLNFDTLSLIDDLAKFLVVDPYLNFKVMKVNDSNKNFIKSESNDLFKIIKEFLDHKNYEKTLSALQKCIKFKELPINLQNDLLFNFERHICMYLKIINPQSIVAITETLRYKAQNKQVKICARCNLKKNENVEDLRGFCATLSVDDEIWLESQKKDFSVMRSSRSKCTFLLLGAVAFINHDCDANCYYRTNDKGEVFVTTKRNIRQGEEITCFYDKDYFGIDNLHCLCSSCESKCTTNVIDKENIETKDLKNKQINFESTEEVSKAELPKELKEFNALRNDFMKCLKDFKIITEKLQRTKSDFNCHHQRKYSNTENKGLKFNNELYSSLITVLKQTHTIMDLTAKNFDLSSNEIDFIVKHVYKNDHPTSHKAVSKFMQEYKIDIEHDLKSTLDNNNILAPEFRKTQNYTNKLIAACICFYYKEFAECIYKGEKMPLDVKRFILEKIHGCKYTQSEKSKLDNYFNMYNIYLQEKSQNIVNIAMKYEMLQDINKRKIQIVLEPLQRQKMENGNSMNYSIQDICDIIGVTNNALKTERLEQVNKTFLNTEEELKCNDKCPNDLNKKECNQNTNMANTVRIKLIDGLAAFELNNNDKQVSILKKLIILKLYDHKSNDIDQYVSNVRVSKKIKKNILHKIYAHKIEEIHYNLLDLLKPYSYLLKEKLKNLREFFKSNNILIKNLMIRVSNFQEFENAVYKAISEAKKLSSRN